MTSVARSIIDGGTARPSAFAVLRFTTISNLVGNCTGDRPASRRVGCDRHRRRRDAGGLPRRLRRRAINLCSTCAGLYHAVPTNARALAVFRHHVTDLWRRTLRRRSQKDRITWARMAKLADDFLPKPIILHPWPSDRFAVTHPSGSSLRESRKYGSVRGARGNSRPYRDSI